MSCRCSGLSSWGLWKGATHRKPTQKPSRPLTEGSVVQWKGHQTKPPHLPAQAPYQSFQDGSEGQVVTRGVQQQSPVREAGKVHDFGLVDVVLHTENTKK